MSQKDITRKLKEKNHSDGKVAQANPLLSVMRFQDFPADITRIVLEEAARSCSKTALILLSVSHVIRKCIEPLIYREVSLPDPLSVSLFRQSIRLHNDDAFFARAVRVLTIDMEKSPDAEYILSICSGLSSLTLLMLRAPRDKDWSHRIPDLRYLHALKHLNISDATVLDVDRLPPNVSHFGYMLVGRYSRGAAESLMCVLRGRRSITHVMSGTGLSIYDNDETFEIIDRLKDSEVSLRVFVVVCGSGLRREWEGEEGRVEDEFRRMREGEARVVVVNVERKQFGRVRGVTDVDFGREDVWEVAEGYLAKE